LSKRKYRIIQRSVKNSNTPWQIIKKESGNSFIEIENTSLEMDSVTYKHRMYSNKLMNSLQTALTNTF
jgi:hypothetical protein